MKRITLAVMAVALVSALMIAGTTAAQPTGGPPPAPPVDFNTNVRPIFANRCASCHGAAVQRGGLRLDDREAALRGSASGPVIVPGHSDQSKLYQIVASKKMPLDDELSVLELEALKERIAG